MVEIQPSIDDGHTDARSGKGCGAGSAPDAGDARGHDLPAATTAARFGERRHHMVWRHCRDTGIIL
jgi:hypothetical protein